MPLFTDSSNQRSIVRDVALIVVTCDKYSDLWLPCCERLAKFWSDCPFQRFITTNQKGFSHPYVEALPVGPDKSWSDSLRTAVSNVPHKYVLLIQEDFLLEQAVDSGSLIAVLEKWVEIGGEYLRLATSPKPKNVKKYRRAENLVEIPPDSPYRVSNQASVWQKDLLLDLLAPGESPWQMETSGSIRTFSKGSIFFSVEKSVLNYHPHGALVKGKWRRSAARSCKQEGSWNSSREIQSVLAEVGLIFRNLAFNLLYRTSATWLWKRTLARYGDK